MELIFALTPNEIRVLEVLSSEPRTPTSISKTLRISMPHLSRILRHLSQKGFIKTEKHGLSKEISLANTKHATIFRKVRSEFGHIKLEQILTTSFLEVLSTLGFNQPLSRKEIVEDSSISERTLHVVLKRLRSRGIATVDSVGLYSIDTRFSILVDFALELRHYANNSLASSFSHDAVILWERNKEFIIKSSESEERDGFLLTAFSQFHNFGVTLFVPDYYHYYASWKRKLSIEDVILHSLLMRPSGTRELTAVLLLFKKNQKHINVDRLLEKAQKYDLTDEVSRIVEYVTTQGLKKAPEFPEWKELAVKIKEYEM